MTKVCVDCGAAIDVRSERCRSCAAKAQWRDPDVRRKRTEGFCTAWADDEVRAARVKAMLEGNRDPAVHARRSAAALARWSSGVYGREFRQRQRQKQLAIWDDRRRRWWSERVKEQFEQGERKQAEWSDERRARVSEAACKQWADAGNRSVLSAKARRRWAEGCYDGVFQRISKPHRRLIEALDVLGVKHITEHRFQGTRFPFDEYFPTLGLLIEVDGRYWHSLKKQVDRDASKTALAQERGLLLVRVPAELLTEDVARELAEDIVSVHV